MGIPVTVIGFGLVVLGRAILGQLRANYLREASENISLDPSMEIVLRHAIWDYIFPVLLFAGGVFMGWGAYHTPIPQAALIYKTISAVCFLGGAFLSYLELTGKVVISNNTLTYREGADRRVINTNEVRDVRLNGFAILVKLKSDKVVKIPATFQHSEIILAFLKQAAVNK